MKINLDFLLKSLGHMTLVLLKTRQSLQRGSCVQTALNSVPYMQGEWLICPANTRLVISREGGCGGNEYIKLPQEESS